MTLKVAGTSIARRLSLATAWLERSGTRPLSITFTNGPDDTVLWPGNKLWQKFLLSISHHFCRLEHLEIGATLIGPSLQLMRSPMPRLTHLTLWVNHICTQSEPLILTPENFPLLQSLELHHYTRYRTIEFPWKQITTLICDDLNCDDFGMILGQASALLRCEVSNLICGVGTDMGGPITVPHLESLIFSLYRVAETSVYHAFPIAAMTLPALRNLQVPEAYLRHPSFEDLGAFVTRSGCSLEKLRIIDLTHTSKQSYMDKFPSIPSISFRRQFPGVTAENTRLWRGGQEGGLRGGWQTPR